MSFEDLYQKYLHKNDSEREGLWDLAYKALEIEDYNSVKIICAFMIKKYLPDKLKDRISITQFRSYNFLPRIAHYLWDKKDVVGEKWSLYEVPEVPEAIWWVDSFGNCKTTLFSDEIGFEDKKKIQTNLGKLTCYKSLKDVPDKQAALIVGSSGLGQKRFIELVVQGGRAAGAFNLRVRDEVKIVNK